MEKNIMSVENITAQCKGWMDVRTIAFVEKLLVGNNSYNSS